MKIINHYGLIHQLKKLNEEVFELIDAEYEMYYTLNSTNYERLIDHIVEEYADVQNVLEEHRLYWELALEDIRKVQEYKVDRTSKEMKDEELLRSTTRTRISKK